MTHPIVTQILAEARAMGLAPRKLCRLADLGPDYLADLKRKESEPSADALMSIACLLHTTPDALRAEAARAPACAAEPGPALIRLIPHLDIYYSPLNPRRTVEQSLINELADSIAAQGLLQNLVVRANPDKPGGYWVVAGSRRLDAITHLAWDGRLPAALEAGLPCRVIEASDAEHIAVALLENLQRQNVNPMEEAEGFAALHQLDPQRWSTENIARAIGCTQRLVQQRLQLANALPDPDREALRRGDITVEQARAAVARPRPKDVPLPLGEADDDRRRRRLLRAQDEMRLDKNVARAELAAAITERITDELALRMLFSNGDRPFADILALNADEFRKMVRTYQERALRAERVSWEDVTDLATHLDILVPALLTLDAAGVAAEVKRRAEALAETAA